MEKNLNQGDSLLAQSAEARTQSLKAKPSIKETNMAYFVFLLFFVCTLPLLPVLNGALTGGGFVGIAVTLFFSSVVTFILGNRLEKEEARQFRGFYFLSVLLLSFSVLTSFLAVTTYKNIQISTSKAFIGMGIFAVLTVLDLIVLSIGKRERLMFSLMTLLYVAAVVFGGVVLFKNNDMAFGLPLFVYSLIFLFLHFTMTLYVFIGDGFYGLMCFSYFIIAIAALLIALMVVTESGDCVGDCGCVDCTFSSGGRRSNVEKIKKL